MCSIGNIFVYFAIVWLVGRGRGGERRAALVHLWFGKTLTGSLGVEFTGIYKSVWYVPGLAAGDCGKVCDAARLLRRRSADGMGCDNEITSLGIRRHCLLGGIGGAGAG